MNKNDFTGMLGEDYDIATYFMPHYYEFEDKVGKIVSIWSKAQKKKEITVLEAGCGTGITTERIIRANPRIKISAVDISPVTLSQAKIKLKEFHGRINFIESDITDFLDNTKLKFDAFVSVFTLHNFDKIKWKAVLNKAFDLLKPNGLFIIGDKIANDDEPTHEKNLAWQIKQIDYLEKINRPDLKRAWIKHYLDDEKKKIKKEDLIESLEEAGFVDVRLYYRKRMEVIITATKQEGEL